MVPLRIALCITGQVDHLVSLNIDHDLSSERVVQLTVMYSES